MTPSPFSTSSRPTYVSVDIEIVHLLNMIKCIITTYRVDTFRKIYRKCPGPIICLENLNNGIIILRVCEVRVHIEGGTDITG